MFQSLTELSDVAGKLCTFADGSLVCNNPVFEAVLEAKRVRGRHLPQIVVSLGTGEPSVSKKCSISTPFGNKPAGMIRLSAQRVIRVDDADIPLYSQATHEDFVKHVPAAQQAGSTLRYERFNPPNLHVTPMDTPSPGARLSFA
mgnify:CR=1 FL=1